MYGSWRGSMTAARAVGDRGLSMPVPAAGEPLLLAAAKSSWTLSTMPPREAAGSWNSAPGGTGTAPSPPLAAAPTGRPRSLLRSSRLVRALATPRSFLSSSRELTNALEGSWPAGGAGARSPPSAPGFSCCCDRARPSWLAGRSGTPLLPFALVAAGLVPRPSTTVAVMEVTSLELRRGVVVAGAGEAEGEEVAGGPRPSFTRDFHGMRRPRNLSHMC
mmetsp:Transcript_7580/g.21670  ORF Transcript_7580/g.21670 Transcript_7580/m.21670 type:complete len:218 (-) Transcript_7580:1847-2500(-)